MRYATRTGRRRRGIWMGGILLCSLLGGCDTTATDQAEEVSFDNCTVLLNATDYDERRHYFLGYYFRNRWEAALSAPPDILVEGGFQSITAIEVWKSPAIPGEQNRQIVAVVDLGEPQNVVTDADAYLDTTRPNPDIDQYTDGEIAQRLRPGDAVPKDFLESMEMNQPLTASAYQVGQFKKLELGIDYDVNEMLGYITLTQRLQEFEALAVAFRYRDGTSTVQVGDFSADFGSSETSERLVLKLLKPVNLSQPGIGFNPAAWYLEMRNVYRIPLSRASSFRDLALQIFYGPPELQVKTLSGVSSTQPLLHITGLDRLSDDGTASPDGRLDFMPYFTVGSSNGFFSDGFLLFPVLEPFGQTLARFIEEAGTDGITQAEAHEIYVFDDLYQMKKINAMRSSQRGIYSLCGVFPLN